MPTYHHRSVVAGVIALVLVLIMCGLYIAPAQAQKRPLITREIQLDQLKALAGNITPGDAPGFPITITRPGRYVLTSNLDVSAGANGIVLKTSDVTIDFNGFRLAGRPNAVAGIVGDVNTVRIMNGLIVTFKYYAISGGDSWVVENMLISANGAGIALGNFARVQRNTVSLMSLHKSSGNRWHDFAGVTCSKGCHIEGNVIGEGNGVGVSLVSGTVLGNTIINNKNGGILSLDDQYHIQTDPSLGVGADVIGLGNNTILRNGKVQMSGNFLELHPNAVRTAKDADE
jgi:hypothetical protein